MGNISKTKLAVCLFHFSFLPVSTQEKHRQKYCQTQKGAARFKQITEARSYLQFPNLTVGMFKGSKSFMQTLQTKSY